MSEQEKRFDDLTPFETALAALAPRVEGFDRERLIFLAGQASALRERGAGVSPAARWAWPAAFSAMTAVAAALLAMLCIRGQPEIRGGAGGGVPEVAVSGTLRVPTTSGTRSVPDTLTPAPQADAVFPDFDPALRAELRRRGIDFSPPRVAASDRATVVAQRPMTYYELLSRLQGPAGQGGLTEMTQ